MKKYNLLKNKNFMLLWCGHSISGLGDQVYSIAIMWYVMLVTGSTIQMGISLIFTQVPVLIFSTFAGVIADRANRKRILIICDVISSILIGSVFIISLNNKLSISAIYIISFLTSSTGAFFSPSISAVIQSIVKREDLPKANSMNKITSSIYGMVGPSIAGILIALVGVKILFLINSISFLVSALCEVFVAVPIVTAEDRTIETNLFNKFLKDAKEGFLYCKKIKVIFYFMIIAGCIDNFLTAPLNIYIPIYSSKILKLNSSAYGIFMGVLAVGGIFSSILFPFISKKGNLYHKLTAAVIGEGLFMMTFGLSKNFVEVLISLALIGFSNAMANINLNLLMQLLVPNRIMGRVGSIFNVMATITIPLGYFAGGVASTKFPLSPLILLSGVLVTIAGISTIKITFKESVKISA
jgi:MFS family permease